ncbi:MAG: RsmD family RNA methyltransferase [Pirellulaceae bacterium]|nr:RsmD family RNA methyltransferase [Pirellulaceae bacterium]
MKRPPKNRPSKSPSRRSQDADSEIAGVRIIGGKLRHRQLEYSGDLRTRPMKDRVRESVFNLVGPAIAGTQAIDLFAGTGALGLEALSRGAIFATLIERHYPTRQLIKQNAKALGVEEKCEVVFGDAFLWARKHVSGASPRVINPSAPWLVFCSPPFEFYVSRLADMLELIATLWSAAPKGSLFLVEADERLDFGLLPEPARWDVRNYRPAIIGLATKE